MTEPRRTLANGYTLQNIVVAPQFRPGYKSPTPIYDMMVEEYKYKKMVDDMKFIITTLQPKFIDFHRQMRAAMEQMQGQVDQCFAYGSLSHLVDTPMRHAAQIRVARREGRAIVREGLSDVIQWLRANGHQV